MQCRVARRLLGEGVCLGERRGLDALLAAARDVHRDDRAGGRERRRRERGSRRQERARKGEQHFVESIA